jgi:hypothetical protein
MTSKYINLPDLLTHLKANGYTITETGDTSLTVPQDQVNDEAKNKKQAKTARRTKLSEAELDAALEKLVRNWPQVEKRWADPPIPGQTYCSFSFMPSKGVKPDKDGLYGYMKVRGAFSNETDRDAYAEQIINNVDSYHAIHHGMMGHPLPLVDDNDDRYCLEVESVGLKNKIQSDMTKDVKERREKEKDFVEEAKKHAEKEREKEEEALKGNVDHEERYTTLRVKRANLIFTIYQMLTGMKRYKDTLNQTINILDEMDEKHPTFSQTFLSRYNHAAEAAGLPTEKNHIIRYMVGPVPFDLSVIPDNLEVIDPGAPVIMPMDLNLINPHETAAKMSAAASSNKKPKE